MKFGGTSLGDATCIRQAVAIVASQLALRPVVIVSAHAGVTDLLLQLAEQSAQGVGDLAGIENRHRAILRELGLPATLHDALHGELADLVRGLRMIGVVTPRTRDLVASFGERISARTFAAALLQSGIAATAVDAAAVGLRTDSSHGRARPLPDDGRIAAACSAVVGVPVVTGFIAADEQGNVTTLGRNGSDYSAALFGAALSATEIQIWKDVDGVRTADPKLVPEAMAIRQLSYAEACEMASFGSKVLHPAAMIPAMQKGIAITVRNTADAQAPGTRIDADGGARPLVRAIAHRRGVRTMVVTSQRLLPQRAFLARVFAALEEAESDAEFVAASESAALVALAHEPEASLRAKLAMLGEMRLEGERGLIGVVGEPGELRRRGASRTLELLATANVTVLGAGMGAHGSSFAVVVADRELPIAVRALHDGFFAPAQKP